MAKKPRKSRRKRVCAPRETSPLSPEQPQARSEVSEENSNTNADDPVRTDSTSDDAKGVAAPFLLQTPGEAPNLDDGDGDPKDWDETEASDWEPEAPEDSAGSASEVRGDSFPEEARGESWSDDDAPHAVETLEDVFDTTPSEAWPLAKKAHDLAVQLKRIETEIRSLLEKGDVRRKRRYEGTRRWLELQEDLVTMRFNSSIPDQDLQRIQTLVAQRQRLFRLLNFVAGARHHWNT